MSDENKMSAAEIEKAVSQVTSVSRTFKAVIAVSEALERIGKLEIMGNDNAERERARQHEEDRRFLAGWGGGVGFSLQLASAGRRNGVSPPPQR